MSKKNSVPDNCKPGSFGCHEILDRTLLAQEIVDEYILNHPSIEYKKKWVKLAEKASNALAALYQDIGKEHM